MALAALAFVMSDGASVLRGELADPDSYARLLRVSHLHETGRWFDTTLPGSNAPHGGSLHWTRPFDLLLLVPAWMGAPWAGFQPALYWAGVLISPLLLIAACLLLVWAARPLWSGERRVWLAPLMFCQLGLFAYSTLGRADHHALIIGLSVAVLGWGLRVAVGTFDRPTAALAGLFAGGAIWVSPEGLFFVGITHLLLAAQWVEGRPGAAPKGLWVSVGTTGMLAVAVLAEHPWAQALVVEHDKVSLVHLAAGVMAAATWSVLARLRGVTGRLPRLAALAAAAGAGVLVLGGLAPGFQRGPFAAVDPRLHAVWLPRIAELQPQFPVDAASAASFLQLLGAPALAIPFALGRLWRSRNEQAAALHVPLAIAYLALFALALGGRRLSIFVEILAPLYLIDLLRSVRSVPRWSGAGRLLRVAIAPLVCLGPLLVGLGLGAHAAAREARASSARPLAELAAWLDQQGGTRPRTILAQDASEGPELLYRTRHRVVASPYHREHRGILDLYDTWNAPSDGEAKEIIDRRRVDLVVTRRRATLRYLYPGSKPEETFFYRLQTARTPAWLSSMELPPHLADDWQVYAVLR